MAKKKKVNSQLPFYLTIGILVVAILGVVLFLFLDAVTLKEVESTGFDIKALFADPKSTTLLSFKIALFIKKSPRFPWLYY